MGERKGFYVTFDKLCDYNLIKQRTLWKFDKNEVDLSTLDFSHKRQFLSLLGSDTSVFPLELYCDYEVYNNRYTIVRHMHELKTIIEDIKKRTDDVMKSEHTNYDNIDVYRLKTLHNKLYSKKKKHTTYYYANMFEVYKFFNCMIHIVNYGNKKDIENLITICKQIDMETRGSKMFSDCFRLISIAFDDGGDDTRCSVAIIPFIKNPKHEIGKCDFEIVLVETFFGRMMRKREERVLPTMLSGYVSKKEYGTYKNGLYWKRAFKKTVQKEVSEELSVNINEYQIFPLIKRVVNAGDFNKEIFVYGVELTEKNVDEICKRKMICQETTKIDVVSPQHFVYINERTGWRGDSGFRKTIIEKLYKELYVPNAW
jgi:hypothetical protein